MPTPCPSGVKSSITSWEVPAGTVAAKGVVTTVPDWAFVTLIVVVAIWVSDPGNPAGKFVVVCRRTVTGWVTLADSTPKETELTLYCTGPTNVPISNALQ